MTTELELYLSLIGLVIWLVVGLRLLKLPVFWGLFLGALAYSIYHSVDITGAISGLGAGFGSALGKIGLIIYLGAVLSEQLKRKSLLEKLSGLLSSGLPVWAIYVCSATLSSLISIAVFCDAAFIILSGVYKQVGNSLVAGSSKGLARLRALDRQAGKWFVLINALFLYIAHTFLPPTPGPLASMSNLGLLDDFLTILLCGLGFVALCLMILALSIRPLTCNHTGSAETFDRKVIKHLIPILAPVLLLMIGNIVKQVMPEIMFVSFLAEPLVALMLAILLTYFWQAMSRSDFAEDSKTAFQSAGEIIFITGMGAALGSVIRNSIPESLVESALSNDTSVVALILMTYAVSAIFKTLQGSSTAAIIIVSSIVGGGLIEAGFSQLEMLAIYFSIGSGAMILSHVNDSYFWVIQGFGELDEKTLIYDWNLLTVAVSLLGLVFAVVLGLVGG